MTGAGNIEVPTKERLKEVIYRPYSSDANAISRYKRRKSEFLLICYGPLLVAYGKVSCLTLSLQ